jgi:hypothetical protein
MTDNRPNAIFNIGSQHGNVSNVAGDMTVYGGQHYTGFPAELIRQELGNLQRAISAMGLDPAVQEKAAALLADADHELSRAGGDAKKVARPIERLAGLLKSIGAIAVSGAALIDPLQRIASWLGPAGQAILHLIT